MVICWKVNMLLSLYMIIMSIYGYICTCSDKEPTKSTQKHHQYIRNKKNLLWLLSDKNDEIRKLRIFDWLQSLKIFISNIHTYVNNFYLIPENMALCYWIDCPFSQRRSMTKQNWDGFSNLFWVVLLTVMKNKVTTVDYVAWRFIACWWSLLSKSRMSTRESNFTTF